MSDLTVIILTKNEKLHIRRCLERLEPIEATKIYIVDCFSSDGTQEIARGMGAEVVEREWPGNQAVQFNWALDNLPIKTKWVLRIDADEWLTQELIDEINEKLPFLNNDIEGVIMKRRNYFGGGWVKRGIYPTRILRLFRVGTAKYSDAMTMDEHLIVRGRIIEFDKDFVDESLMPFEDWKNKHRDYAKREAQMVVCNKINANKRLYYSLPPYIRSFSYFCYRYLFRLGFLDGYKGWKWHFWQGLWYRSLVDYEIMKLRK